MVFETKQATQCMERITLDVEELKDNLSIISYLGCINNDDEELSNALQSTFFEMIKKQGKPLPNETAIARWNFASGYCIALLEQGLSLNDRKLITKDGLDYLERSTPTAFRLYEEYRGIQENSSLYPMNVDQIYGAVSSKISSKEVAYQFILEEMDAASYGNEEAKLFVKNNRFLIDEFRGSMGKSMPEVDGANGPQQTLTRLTINNIFSRDELAKVRIQVVQRIIDNWFVDNECSDINLDYFFSS